MRALPLLPGVLTLVPADTSFTWTGSPPCLISVKHLGQGMAAQNLIGSQVIVEPEAIP